MKIRRRVSVSSVRPAMTLERSDTVDDAFSHTGRSEEIRYELQRLAREEHGLS